MTALSAKAVNASENVISTRTQKLFVIAQARMDELTTPGSLVVDNFKEVFDFNGNSFIVFEYLPTGYAIFCEKSGTFLETAPESPSPYLNYTNAIYYGGPQQYFILENNVFTNTITNTQLNANNVMALKEFSQELDKKLTSSKNNKITNYLNNNSSTYNTATRSITETFYVDNYSRLRNLSACGYVNGGYCGYIAAAMLLYYFDSTGHRNVIPGTNSEYYYTSNGKYVLTDKLTEELIDIGEDLGFNPNTTSYAIHRVVKQYLSNKSITGNIDHTSLFTPLFTKFQISQKINNNEPVIIFGDHYSPSHNDTIFHAVLAYGYRATISYDEEIYGTTTYEFIVHFGYDSYPFVYLDGIFGSIYSLSC